MSYYTNIFENLPFPCLLFEKKENVFIIKEANTNYCKATNKTEEELKGRLVQDVFPENPYTPSELKEVQKSLEITHSTQKSHRIEVLRYDLLINGVYEERYWETENVPIHDENSGEVYILNVVKDITAQIMERGRGDLLQIKLDANTENHEQFIERITDGLFSLDRVGNFMSVNTGLTEITETGEAELLKMNFLPFCGEDHREKIVGYFDAALAGTNQKFEANFISATGKKRILEISLVPLKNDRYITGLYGIAKDITRLKEIETALKKSERKFKALVQEGSDLIGILDMEGRYKFVSETSTSVLGITPDEFIGKSAFEFIHPEDLDWVLNEFTNLGLRNQAEIKPFRFKNAKGEWRWVETKATNLINDPAIEGIVTNSRDVTERKIVENDLLALNKSLETSTEELIRAVKGLEQFSYIISHNLRAPMANILGLTSLLEDEEYPEEVKRNLRNELSSNAKRMDKVMKDLNQILQVKHDFSEVKTSIDLNETVTLIKKGLQDLIEKEKINIVTDFKEIEKITSISSFIHSIFYNLIFNSIKFRRPGVDAVLNIKSEKKNGIIRFIFEDNGVGLDLTKKKDEIFGLYKRFHHHVEGKGMGLFMVKTQVDMLGGTISMDSKVNSGSTFIIEFKKEILLQ